MSYIIIRFTDDNGVDREVVHTVSHTEGSIMAAASRFFRQFGNPKQIISATLIDKRVTESTGAPKGYGRKSTTIVHAR